MSKSPLSMRRWTTVLLVDAEKGLFIGGENAKKKTLNIGSKAKNKSGA